LEKEIIHHNQFSSIKSPREGRKRLRNEIGHFQTPHKQKHSINSTNGVSFSPIGKYGQSTRNKEETMKPYL